MKPFIFAAFGALAVTWYFKSRLVVTSGSDQMKRVAMGVRG